MMKRFLHYQHMESKMEFKHVSVLYEETIEGLNVNPEGIYLDGTLGGGGHSEAIVKQLTTGKLICNDLDMIAINASKERLADYSEKIIYVHDDYKNILTHLDEMGIEKLDGALLDLGISSPQIDNPERGFSYMKDAPLDMRMDRDSSFSARDVINDYSESELIRVFRDYGEEKFAKKIASKIVRDRQVKPIETTGELATLIEKCYPAGYRFKFGHPAKRVFQAVRIEVNGELDGLQEFVTNLTLRLKKGGRIAIITFHSLEDRIVKNAFVELEKDCICDKRLPVCVCGKRKEINIITRKPITASEEELAKNKRAESAKLRVAERV